MARISSYPTDQNIVGSDKVIGTDNAGAITKNYTLDGISSWMNAEGTIGIAGQNNFFFQPSTVMRVDYRVLLVLNLMVVQIRRFRLSQHFALAKSQ